LHQGRTHAGSLHPAALPRGSGRCRERDADRCARRRLPVRRAVDDRVHPRPVGRPATGDRDGRHTRTVSDLAALSRPGGMTARTSALEPRRPDFGGDIIEPGAADYEAASRSVFATGSPVYVLRPKTVTDVQAGVKFAAATGLALSVRGGGHGFPGFGTNDGGIVIDLGQLADVKIIDKERHVVRIGGGATWGQGATAPAPHGPA